MSTGIRSPVDGPLMAPGMIGASRYSGYEGTLLIRRFTRNDRDAALVAAVVQALEPRFEAIENRLDAMDRRFEAIEGRLDGMDGRFVSIDHRFEAIGNRFGAMDVKWERRFVALADEMSKLRVGYADVREHVVRLHENVNARMDAFDARMDGFEARLNEMGEEFAAQFAALSETVVHGFSRPEPA